MKKRHLFALGIVFGLLIATGFGFVWPTSPTAEIQGAVTFAGNPVRPDDGKLGIIEFFLVARAGRLPWSSVQRPDSLTTRPGGPVLPDDSFPRCPIGACPVVSSFRRPTFPSCDAYWVFVRGPRT